MGIGEVSNHPRQRPEPIDAVGRCRLPHITTVSAVRPIASFFKAFALESFLSTTLTQATRARISAVAWKVDSFSDCRRDDHLSSSYVMSQTFSNSFMTIFAPASIADFGIFKSTSSPFSPSPFVVPLVPFTPLD